MKKFLLILMVSFIFFGCSNDDDTVAEPILGSWELTSLENEADHTAPNDEKIVVTFKDNEYTGKTAVNEFGGDYEIAGNRLFLTNSYTTEAEDTAWGNMFYEALRSAYHEEKERSEFLYTLQGERLSLWNDEEMMTFNRLK